MNIASIGWHICRKVTNFSRSLNLTPSDRILAFCLPLV